MCQSFYLLFDVVSTNERIVGKYCPLSSRREGQRVFVVVGLTTPKSLVEETFAAASFSHFDFSFFSTSCVCLSRAAIAARGW